MATKSRFEYSLRELEVERSGEMERLGPQPKDSWRPVRSTLLVAGTGWVEGIWLQSTALGFCPVRQRTGGRAQKSGERCTGVCQS